MTKRLAKFLPLGIMTIGLIADVAHRGEIGFVLGFYAPILWLLPVAFLLIWRKFGHTSLLSTPLVLAVGTIPLARAIVFNLLELVSRFDFNQDFSFLVLFAAIALSEQIAVVIYSAIQAILLAMLWISAFGKEKSVNEE